MIDIRMDWFTVFSLCSREVTYSPTSDTSREHLIGAQIWLCPYRNLSHGAVSPVARCGRLGIIWCQLQPLERLLAVFPVWPHQCLASVSVHETDRSPVILGRRTALGKLRSFASVPVTR